MSPSRVRLILVSAIWAIFFVFGFQLAGVGPLISSFAAQAGVSVETVGILFTAQSLAALASAAMIGPVLERFNIRPVIMIGVASVCTGIFGLMVAASLPALLAAGAFIGFGVGFMDTGGQLLIIALYGDQSARPLNSLHFLFSVGAVIGPLLAVPFGVATFALAVAVLLAALPLLAWTLPRGLKTGSIAAEADRPASLYRSPVLWLFGLLFLLYVGLEIGVGNWTTEYMADSAGVDRDAGGLTTSLYWFSFMFSRLIVTALGSRLTFERQLTMSVTLSLLGAVLYIMTTGNVIGTIAVTVVIGFAFGPVYPAGFAIVARTFSASAGRAAGVIGMAGSIGAMTLVPMQGVILERSSPTAMAVFVAVVSAAMLACYLFAVRGSNAMR